MKKQFMNRLQKLMKPEPKSASRELSPEPKVAEPTPLIKKRAKKAQPDVAQKPTKKKTKTKK